MSDFVDSLVDRSLGAGPTLRPRLASRFEPERATPHWRGIESDQPNGIDHQTSQEFDLQSDRPAVDVNRLSRPDTCDEPTGHVAGQTDRLFGVPSLGEASSTPPIASQGEVEVPHSPPIRFQSVLPPSVDQPQVDLNWLERRLDALSTRVNDWHDSHPALSPSPSEKLVTTANPHQAVVSKYAPEVAGPMLRTERRDPEPGQSRLRSPVDSLPRPEIIVEKQVPRERSESREELLAMLSTSQLRSPPMILPESLAASSNQSNSSQPTVNVTIGRVEVRATREGAAERQTPKAPKTSSVMTLADYLKRRAAGAVL